MDETPPTTPPAPPAGQAKPKKKFKLSLRERRFAREYVSDYNGLRAAIRSGCPEAGARTTADRLLKKAEVIAEITRLEEEQRKRLKITADMVVDEIRNLAYSDIGDILEQKKGVLSVRNIHDLPPEVRRCISSVKITATKTGKPIVEVKLWDKGQKLKELATHLGITTDRTQHTGDAANPIAVSVERYVDGKRKAEEHRALRALPLREPLREQEQDGETKQGLA